MADAAATVEQASCPSTLAWSLRPRRANFAIGEPDKRKPGAMPRGELAAVRA
jgi:hypothetical protein